MEDFLQKINFMWKRTIAFLDRLCTTDIVVGSDFKGDYVEINGERHYHNGSEKIKFKNCCTAIVKVTLDSIEV